MFHVSARLLLFGGVLCLVAGGLPAADDDDFLTDKVAFGDHPQPAICFAPTDDLLLQNNRESWVSDLAARHSLAPAVAVKFEFSESDRWSWTSSNGGGLSQGDATTLTWSIVPDGTPITGGYGEPAAPSDLRAFLNGIYGTMGAWLPLFESVFDRWSELSGITYVYMATDDGSTLPTSPGLVGVRADIRIGGHFIDGTPTPNVLAYNYYPDYGDMVIDTGDTFFNDTSSNSLRLRNTVAHEHGHGLGLDHVCPMNQTKLMEPMISLAYDGPQHDDILAVNRGYGDRHENNDIPPVASNLGSVSSVTQTNLSLDSNTDVDVYSFTVGPGEKLGVTVTPTGSTYLSGPQNANGTCSAGSSTNTLTMQDIAIRVLGPNGSTELASADDHGVGVAESLIGVSLFSGGTYFIEVTGDSSDMTQLYRLSLSVAPSDTNLIFEDDFESHDTDAWSSAVQ